MTYFEFEVSFTESGSFFIQIQAQHDNHTIYSPPNYINVDPVLFLRGQPLICKQMSIMTVLSRQLGPLRRWNDVLAPIASQVYNAIHFTPI